MSNYGSEIRPFRVEIPHEALDDLRDRLDRVRWTTEVPGPAPEAYGCRWPKSAGWPGTGGTALTGLRPSPG